MPSYFILLHCSPITMHLPPFLLLLLPRLSAITFLMPTTLAHLYSVLPNLASFSRSRSSQPPFHTHHHHHQHPPIHHLTATYIVARNATESYSVSLDSLKQVLMSCTPIPRTSPATYPLATERSSGILVPIFHSLPSFHCVYVSLRLSIYLYVSLSILLSPSLFYLFSVSLIVELSSSPKNRQVRYYRRHVTNAELVVIDWMPESWICQLMWQTNSLSPRFPFSLCTTFLRVYVAFRRA